MKRLAMAGLICLRLAAQDAVVFRSDTTLVRVDVQVLDAGNRAIAGLDVEAFVLREQGQVRAIKNFVREDLPIDLLFLIDVSGSMRPHVERMAEAARRALPSLRREDRVAVMVFDRQSRLRMPFRPGPGEAQREFENLLRSETFNGGTDITRALFDGAQFMKRQARIEARRAIVLLTDDETEFEADEDRVVRALQGAETVMSVLLVPNGIRRIGHDRRPRHGCDSEPLRFRRNHAYGARCRQRHAHDLSSRGIGRAGQKSAGKPSAFRFGTCPRPDGLLQNPPHSTRPLQ